MSDDFDKFAQLINAEISAKPIHNEQSGNPEASSKDKRTEPRCAVSLRVSYKTFDEFMDEYTKNVSRRGMFIRTTRPHKLHEIAELDLYVPELPDPIRIKGEIVHVNLNAPRAEDSGVGIKFLDIDDQSREALISFIKSRDNFV